MLEEGQKDDWFSSSFIVTMAVIGMGGLSLFIWRELTTEHPAVDLRILRFPSLAAGSMYSMVLGMGIYGALFAVPIFTQSILHFTAMQTGLLLLPGALTSAAMMVLMGKATRWFDPRFLILTGGLITVAVMFSLSHLNPQTGTEELFWPLIWRGAGTVMMFLPLSLATLGPLPKEAISAGSGLYNLTRQLGGSIGIALLTTLLAQREAFHRTILVESVSLYNNATAQRLDQLSGALFAQGINSTMSNTQALKLIDQVINTQAAILSFEDIFRVVGIIFICSLPLVFFLGRPSRDQSIPSKH
jgi:DHA2 family multidrug resistance protein